MSNFEVNWLKNSYVTQGPWFRPLFSFFFFFPRVDLVKFLQGC